MARVTQLEQDVRTLSEQLTELRTRPAPQPAETQPVVTVTPEPVAETPADEPDDDAELQKRIEQIVAEMGKGEAAAKAVRSDAENALNGKDDDQREQAAGLLAALAAKGDLAAREALLAALKSDNPDVREDALAALGSLGIAEFLPILQEAAADPDAGVRAQVAAALGKLPADQSGPLLVAMLGDADPKVLRKAADSLGDLRYAPASRDLLSLVNHQDERVAIEAAVALRRIGDSSAAEQWVPTFGMRLRSDKVSERREAVKQLRRMRVESARIYLEQALNDPDEAIRKEAAKGLKELR
jgi:HEAT repeat protein